jgi:hypothetical protein
VDLTLCDSDQSDAFIPASQLKYLDLDDRSASPNISDTSVVELNSQDEIEEPWDAWQSWDDTDNYEDPGIPSINRILWEDDERARYVANLPTLRNDTDDIFVLSPEIDVDVPPPLLRMNNAQFGDEKSSDNEEEGDQPKKRTGPKRNPTFLDPPHGALSHPYIGWELDQAAMDKYLPEYARQEGAAFTRKRYARAPNATVRWRCHHAGKYNDHRGLPRQVTRKSARKERVDSGTFLHKCPS